jgi:hypothetical protein
MATQEEIKECIDLGRTLQIDHPEIAEMYGYYDWHEIEKMLNAQSKYNVDEDCLGGAVTHAIVGHDGGNDAEAYEGLVSKDENSRIRDYWVWKIPYGWKGDRDAVRHLCYDERLLFYGFKSVDKTPVDNMMR